MMESTITEEPYQILPSAQSKETKEQNTYPLLHESVRVVIDTNPEGDRVYRISLADLSPGEREILASIQNELDEQRERHSPSASPTKRKEYAKLVASFSPNLSQKEQSLITSWLFLQSDPVRWMQAVLSDSRVSALIFPDEGGSVSIIHSGVASLLKTSLNPGKEDISRLSRSLLQLPGFPDPIHEPLPVAINDRMTFLITREPSREHGSCIRITKVQKTVTREENKSADPAIPDQDKKVSPSTPALRYSLLSDIVQVELVPDAYYTISLIPLSEDEKTIFAFINGKKNTQAVSHGTWREREAAARQFYQEALLKHAPGIDRRQKNRICSWLIINTDPVQWIRTILADQAVTGIKCISPGVPVTILHTRCSRFIQTNIIPDLQGFHQIAAYFLESSGASTNKKSPVLIRYSNSESISISWVTREKTQFPQISITRGEKRETEAKKTPNDRAGTNKPGGRTAHPTRQPVLNEIKNRIQSVIPDISKNLTSVITATKNAIPGDTGTAGKKREPSSLSFPSLHKTDLAGFLRRDNSIRSDEKNPAQDLMQQSPPVSGKQEKKEPDLPELKNSGVEYEDSSADRISTGDPDLLHPVTRRDKERINAILSGIFASRSRETAFQEYQRPKVREQDDDVLPKKRGLSFSFSLHAKDRTGFRKKKRVSHPDAGDQPIYDPMASPPVDSVLSLQQHEGVVAEEAYWLVQPYAYVAILQNREKERTYLVVEPELSTRERIILEETHETLRDVLIYDKPVGKGDLVLEFGEVAKVVTSYDPKIPKERLHVLFYYLQRNLSGYGKIDPLMHDELLEDISCNGHDIPVFVHHRLYGSMPTTIQFGGEELNRYVLKLSQKADKQVSLTSPLLDAALPNGSRAQITYSDIISTKGSSFTIRKFRTDPMTPATLLSFNTYNSELMAFLWLALENRKSLIVVGGTASGKTSAMNAFSFFIPHNSKIVSLEDTREIQIPHKNWLPVQTRQASSMTDRGTIDLFDLLKASLRQRPEYIIVGEVRGSEAQTLFQAMNSGHTTLSTLHAGTIEEALNRLTNEPINVPAAMFGALDLIIVQTFHYREGRMIRRCDAIHEILLSEGGHLRWNTLYEYNPVEDGFLRKYTHSETLRAIQYMHNWDDAELQYQLDLRKEFLTRFKFKSSSDPRILMRMITDLRRLS